MATAESWQGILEPGERVLWQGRPEPGVRFEGFDIGQTVFGLAFAGFALVIFRVGLGAVAEGPLGILFPIAAAVFLGLGLNMAGGRFFVDAWKRRHTVYSLTDRRAFVATQAFGRRRLKSWRIDSMTSVDLVEDGALQSVGFAGSRTDPVGARGSFAGLADGREVLALMEKVKVGAA